MDCALKYKYTITHEKRSKKEFVWKRDEENENERRKKNKNKKLIAVSQLMPVAMNAEKDPI